MTIIFAGSHSEEVGRGGSSRISCLDALGNVLQSSTPLGNEWGNEGQILINFTLAIIFIATRAANSGVRG